VKTPVGLSAHAGVRLPRRPQFPAGPGLARRVEAAGRAPYTAHVRALPDPSCEKKVLEANRRVFDAVDFDTYEANTSIFEETRQAEIEAILAAPAGSRDRLLDVGCGTGNVLRLARRHFRGCCGVDISPKLLVELGRREPALRLVVSSADRLPFHDAMFDMVTMYGVLHHIVDHRPVFESAFRVLKPDGVLYTDHDPNYFFGRFYHAYYRLRHRSRPGFGSTDAELSEWHHTQTGGLNPYDLRDLLRDVGFRTAELRLWMTTNPALPFFFRMIRRIMRAAVRLHPAPSLFTHFRLIARK
jgi:ubiquinone/menaquinone biosynthesis C-methylase UbiE